LVDPSCIKLLLGPLYRLLNRFFQPRRRALNPDGEADQQQQ
jgi:hypothetical protein